MPLSDEELRLLEQMEQALAQEDPKFASTLRGSAMQRTAKLRTIGAAVVFVLGVVMFLGGATTQQTWLAVLGFAVMVPSATFALATWRGRHAAAGGGHAESSAASLEQSFGPDTQTRRFGVVEGGRSAKKRPRLGKSLGRPLGKPGKSAKPARRQRSAPSGTFMQRMEQRWERRRQQGY